MELPNLLKIIKGFRSPEGLAELEKLLLLIMGCAVQVSSDSLFFVVI